MLAVIHHAHDRLAELAASEDADPDALIATPVLKELGRMRYWPPDSVEGPGARI